MNKQSTIMLFTVIVLLSIAVGQARSQNTVTFVNQSGKPALVKLEGPTVRDISVDDGHRELNPILPGRYVIKVRYGANGDFSYAEGDSFMVKDLPQAWSRTTITLHTVADGNYGIRPISSSQFDAGNAPNQNLAATQSTTPTKKTIGMDRAAAGVEEQVVKRPGEQASFVLNILPLVVDIQSLGSYLMKQTNKQYDGFDERLIKVEKSLAAAKAGSARHEGDNVLSVAEQVVAECQKARVSWQHIFKGRESIVKNNWAEAMLHQNAPQERDEAVASALRLISDFLRTYRVEFGRALETAEAAGAISVEERTKLLDIVDRKQ